MEMLFFMKSLIILENNFTIKKLPSERNLHFFKNKYYK